MKVFVLSSLFVFALSSGIALADDGAGAVGVITSNDGSGAVSSDDGHHHCHGRECFPRTRKTCFNVVCDYHRHDHDHDVDVNHHDNRDRCTAAATFFKEVTLDGGEVVGDSDRDDHVSFEVKCEDVRYNDGARVFVDLLGSRIQGNEGPFPAILLPRGELHTGDDHRSGYHVSPSELELDTYHGHERFHGECRIWTGAE